MKSSKILLPVIGTAAMLAVVPAFATDVFGMRVEVPYSFQAGPHNLPAGTYTIRQEMTSGLVWFHNEDLKKSVVLLPGIRFSSPAV